jgi:hypothetical protein
MEASKSLPGQCLLLLEFNLDFAYTPSTSSILIIPRHRETALASLKPCLNLALVRLSCSSGNNYSSFN